jgi:CheY-like chemotaxis protein
MTTAQILVVDDEQNLRILMKALLERAGYRVILASGG